MYIMNSLHINHLPQLYRPLKKYSLLYDSNQIIHVHMPGNLIYVEV